MSEFIGAREIVGVSEIDKKTPGGLKMVKVVFADGLIQDMPEKRLEMVKSEHESDATKVGEIIRKSVGSMVYGLFHEYGISLSESNAILDEVAQLINAGSSKATNILFNVEYPEDRTLNQINDILLEHAKGTAENNNEATPAGSGSDSSDTQ